MGTLQRHLFPRLEECWERPLTDKQQQLFIILELVQIEKFVAAATPQRLGRKRHDRRARAFVAQAVYNHPHTRAPIAALRASVVLRRTCGYPRRCNIPSEFVFSQAFADFAKMGLGDQVHAARGEQFAKPGLVGHISRDASAFKGWEKPVAPVRPPPLAPRKKVRPRRGEGREPRAETRLERQVRQGASMI